MILLVINNYKSGENGRNNISVRANSHECPIPTTMFGKHENVTLMFIFVVDVVDGFKKKMI